MSSKNSALITLILAAFLGIGAAYTGYRIIGLLFSVLLNGYVYRKSEYYFQEYSKTKRSIIGGLFGLLIYELFWSISTNLINGNVSFLSY